MAPLRPSPAIPPPRPGPKPGPSPDPTPPCVPFPIPPPDPGPFDGGPGRARGSPSCATVVGSWTSAGKTSAGSITSTGLVSRGVAEGGVNGCFAALANRRWLAGSGDRSPPPPPPFRVDNSLRFEIDGFTSLTARLCLGAMGGRDDTISNRAAAAHECRRRPHTVNGSHKIP